MTARKAVSRLHIFAAGHMEVIFWEKDFRGQASEG